MILLQISRAIMAVYVLAAILPAAIWRCCFPLTIIIWRSTA